MDTTTTIRLLDVFEKHMHDAVSEAIAVLSGTGHDGDEVADELGLSEREIAESADLLAADSAEWQRTGEEAGVTTKWPDGNIDSYDSYVTFRCTSGPYEGLNLALGSVAGKGKEGEMVGFHLGTGGGSRRPLTVFFPADNFASTGERLAIIRGKGGGNSRKGYAPGEPLPPAYAAFKTDVLSKRIKGKWNVQAVVATNDELGIKAMLDHTAIQARLRGIVPYAVVVEQQLASPR